MHFIKLVVTLLAVNTKLLEGFILLPPASFHKRAKSSNVGYHNHNTENENGAARYQSTMRTVRYSSSLEKGNEVNKVLNDKKHDESVIDEFEAVIEKEKLKLDTFIDKTKEFPVGGSDKQQQEYYENLDLIDNEISLQKFVKIINEKDRGIIEKEIQYLDAIEIFNIFIEKVFDTIEDVIIMMKRKVDETTIMKGPISADILDEWNDPTLTHKPRVLVVGSGWASHAFVKVIDTDKFRVLNVSPTNYFVFTPMLASSSVGTTEIRSIVESVRESNPTVRFLEGIGVDIDVGKKYLQVKLGIDSDQAKEEADTVSDGVMDIPYDILVYAAGVGPISSSPKVPGLCSENVHFLKSVEDARRLRSSVIDLLEKASQPNISDEERKKLLTFAIVGAGPTGVEYTGELMDFLLDVTGCGKRVSGIRRTLAPFQNLSNYTRVMLIQGAKDVLPNFDEDLQQSAKQALEDKGVEVITNTRVSKVADDGRIVVIHRQADDEESTEEETIETGLIVWAGGTKPLKLTERLICNVDKYLSERGSPHEYISSKSIAGRIPVDKWLRVMGTSGSILGIGDAAVTNDPNSIPLPQTAQVAAQQGAYIARLLNRDYSLNSLTSNDQCNEDEILVLAPPYNVNATDGDLLTRLRLRGAVNAKPFHFLNLGQLAYVGGGEALSQIQFGDKHILNQAGSVGFLLWRSVYVVKQVSTKTRLLVLFDWFKTKIFGRDVTRM